MFLPVAASVRRIGGGVLLSTLPFAAAGAAPDVPADSAAQVVRVRAVRQFQGSYEWMPGAPAASPDWALGGPLETCGTRVDLRAIARDERLPWPASLEPGGSWVLTTLRSVHRARNVIVRSARRGDGPLPIITEHDARVVASDGTLNLALLHVPNETTRAGGLRLARPTSLRPGREVWRGRYVDDSVWTGLDVVRGIEPFVTGDPFWIDALPAVRPTQGIFVSENGAPLVDLTDGRLLGLLANSERLAPEGNGWRWRGSTYAIPVERVRSFLRAVLASTQPERGDLARPHPSLALIGPELADLLGIPEPQGLLALADWPTEAPLILAGDILLRADGRRLGAGGFRLEQVAYDQGPGQRVEIDLSREAGETRVELVTTDLGPRTAAPDGALRFAGAWFQDLPPTSAMSPDGAPAVIVVHVQDGTPANAAQLRAAERVVQVFAPGRAYAIESAADLRRALESVVDAEGFSGEIGLLVRNLYHPQTDTAIRVLRDIRAGERPEP